MVKSINIDIILTLYVLSYKEVRVVVFEYNISNNISNNNL